MTTRRRVLELGAATATWSALPRAIRRALAAPAAVRTGTIQDVKHIVILMQENRSFDHYFGTMRGVRGFGDRVAIPLASGKPVWNQSTGTREITPYHLDARTMNAALIPSTPHDFGNAQAAWNQGRFGFWPRVKTEFSMGYYTRDELPFQYALAEAFTICDAYHCSIATGTDPNRIAFFSGANFDPAWRARGTNATDAAAEATNMRCFVSGRLPRPGYRYLGSALDWPTIPEVLDTAGVTWRIYQDPNNNWNGLMHGCLAFKGFRNAEPGSAIYENGMRRWSLADLAKDVKDGSLPQVSWVLPSKFQSEHPGAPSSPGHGGEFTQRVLNALTSNLDVWSETVFLLTFDENDGLFDHVPPPAVPSYNADGTVAGKATLALDGMYFDLGKGTFDDPFNNGVPRPYLDPDDTVSGNLRPWGLGPRVPMYVISPWSKGGWVNSQVFDHTSVGQFIEQRFGVTIPAISPWHRAVCGDLTSALDFASPNDAAFPSLPDMSGYEAAERRSQSLPVAKAPREPQPLYQETGVRYSRALPYDLAVSAQVRANGNVELRFRNAGGQGVVFHVYDKLHLDRIPRRYTVEAGKDLRDEFWNAAAADDGHYDLWVYGPNGFLRTFKGVVAADAPVNAEAALSGDPANAAIVLEVRNAGRSEAKLTVAANAYRRDGPWTLTVSGGGRAEQRWPVADSGNWYDITLSGPAGFERRFAGRLETGRHGVSDPAMGAA